MFAHIIPGAESAANVYYYTISASANGIDLWADILADNGNVPPAQSTIEVTINSGVEIGAVDNTSGLNYAIDADNNFAGKTLIIKNNGYISGFGGDGGEWDASVPGAGANGGSALNLNTGGSVTIINTGTIAGGGGGGGGNTGTETEPFGPTYHADGGGGAGIPAGSAGDGYPAGANNLGASDGTKTQGGQRSLGVPDDQNPGGDGGNPGVAGVSPVGGASGGAPGYYYQRSSSTSVTFTNSGGGTTLGSFLVY